MARLAAAIAVPWRTASPASAEENALPHVAFVPGAQQQRSRQQARPLCDVNVLLGDHHDIEHDRPALILCVLPEGQDIPAGLVEDVGCTKVLVLHLPVPVDAAVLRPNAVACFHEDVLGAGPQAADLPCRGVVSGGVAHVQIGTGLHVKPCSNLGFRGHRQVAGHLHAHEAGVDLKLRPENGRAPDKHEVEIETYVRPRTMRSGRPAFQRRTGPVEQQEPFWALHLQERSREDPHILTRDRDALAIALVAK
mmetsp:Transcript_125472/g.362993  ORF Transcript_125472/g.362993 Transcript_125472/m.362993 type:complete len:251 (-) Transcript_125472:413-1165(-)